VIGGVLLAGLGLLAAELYVIVLVAHAIGFAPALALLLAVSLLGGSLVRREGARTWRRFRAGVETGRSPDREVVDGALLLLGGALLVPPGFVTDAVGLLLVLPVTRPLFRRLVTRGTTRWLGRRGGVRVVGWGPPERGPGSGPEGGPKVLDGDFLDPPGTVH